MSSSATASRTAAARNTPLSERQLRRISSDLHDGPGQMLALAMLRLDESGAPDADASEPPSGEIKTALNDALRDMRSIAAGLRLPELSQLSTGDTVRRAVDDHVRRTGVPSPFGSTPSRAHAAAPTKIALFRATQELLSNATRHGEGRDVNVAVDEGDGPVAPVRRGSRAGIDTDARRQPRDTSDLPVCANRQSSWVAASRFVARDTGGARITVSWPL